LYDLVAASRANCRTIDRSNGLESACAGSASAPAVDDASGREAAACRKRRRSKEPSRTDESDANKLSRGREVPGREQKSHWRAQTAPRDNGERGGLSALSSSSPCVSASFS